MTEPTDRRHGFAAAESEHRVTVTELFFDLVFVFAITQVTELMSTDPGGERMAQGVIVLCLLWWCFCCFAWLGNAVRADLGRLRWVLLAVMGLAFVVALTVPEAYDDLPGGLSGPVVFVCCYLGIRLLHLAAYWISDPDNRGLQVVLLRSLTSLVISWSFLLAGAIIGGDAQLLLWIVGFVLDFIGIYLTGASGWEIRAPAHWAERHGLIVIIALGESIVATGVGAFEHPVATALIIAALLALALSATLWWLYFNGLQQTAERRLRELSGTARTALARDGYTYLHLPLVGGVVILALGLKETLAQVADAEHHHLSEPLHGVVAWALTGGVGIYLIGLTLFRMRMLRSPRLLPHDVVGPLMLLGWLVVEHVPAIAALAGVSFVVAGMSVLERRLGAGTVLVDAADPSPVD
jgi:low temperature requirement protein LtrA